MLLFFKPLSLPSRRMLYAEIHVCNDGFVAVNEGVVGDTVGIAGWGSGRKPASSSARSRQPGARARRRRRFHSLSKDYRSIESRFIRRPLPFSPTFLSLLLRDSWPQCCVAPSPAPPSPQSSASAAPELRVPPQSLRAGAMLLLLALSTPRSVPPSSLTLPPLL